MQIFFISRLKAEAAGRPRCRQAGGRQQAGFTLLELLVVLLIIGLALGLGLRGNTKAAPQPETQVRALGAATMLAGQEAVLGGSILGLDFFTVPHSQPAQWGYRWLVLDGTQWLPVTPELSRHLADQVLLVQEQHASLEIDQHRVEPEALVDLELPGEPAVSGTEFIPEVLFYPSREVTAFHFVLQEDDAAPSRLTVDLLGGVSIDAH